MFTMLRCQRFANLTKVALPLQRFAFAIPMCLGQQYNMFCWLAGTFRKPCEISLFYQPLSEVLSLAGSCIGRFHH
jgi:hypothetical protein